MTKIDRININQGMANSLEKLASHGGEKMGNYVNAAGKIAIAPMMIMFNPISKESKDNKNWAAIKQPIEAIFTLALQLLALGHLYKGIDHLAKKDVFNFKLVKKAQNENIFPERLTQEIKNGLSKTDALKKLNEECVGVFKDRLGAVATMLLYVPTLAITNKLFPLIAGKVIKDENK